MTLIRLNAPRAMSHRHLRLNPLPGRHLGEDELERMQAYADARLAPLLAGARPGILRGLQVDLPPRRPAAPVGEGCVVRPGLALSGAGALVGLFSAARATWNQLLQQWMREHGTAQAAGVYYLVLRRGIGLIDADLGIDPCRRAEQDPRRDTRIETLGSLALRRLALSQSVAASLAPARVQNQVAALNADASFLAGLEGAVPLALLAVSRRVPQPVDALPPDADASGFQVDWVSQSAGRYLSRADSGYQVLFAQVQEAFGAAIDAALSAEPNVAAPAADAVPDPDALQAAQVAQALEDGLRLDFLPAAGVLPTPLLQGAETPSPRLRWLPRQIGVDMVALPEASVGALIDRHLPRPVIDLRRPTGVRLRLLLAVNERDYRPDLLDIPAIDRRLVDDLYRYHMRAHDIWLQWRGAYDLLYYLPPDELMTGPERRALDLPRPADPPGAPAGFYQRLVDLARDALPLVDGAPAPPYGQFDGAAPTAPRFYLDWLVNGAAPAPRPPRESGLVLQYRVAQVEMGALDNQLRALRARLEKTRDYLLLQRQQLDAQTVSLTALGGGVAGDGSGLQVARWLPFTELKRPLASATPPAVEALRSPGPRGDAASQAPETQRTSRIGLGASFSPPAFMQATPRTSQPVARDFAVGSAALKGVTASSLVARSRSSSVEINLQRDRLDRLAAIPKQTLSQPAIEGRANNFGVLEHIQAEVKEYEAAYRGMRDLIATLAGLFDKVEAEALRTDLEAFGVPLSPNALASDQRERRYPLGRGDLSRLRLLRDRLADGGTEADAAARSRLNGIIDLYGQFLGDRQLTEDALAEDAETDAQRRYEALFQAGRILTHQIAYMEDRYNRLEDELEAGLRDRLRLEGVLDKLAARIVTARQQLDAIDARRAERLGDYGVAQGLSREDWERVYRKHLERSRILTTGIRGLYYLPVRETPLSKPLADPLALRYATAGDPVPGCDWNAEVQLPESLEGFFDTVLEVPMSDWRLLAPMVPKLPIQRVPEWMDLRRSRFTSYAARGLSRGPSAGRLAPLSRSTDMLFRSWASEVPRADAASASVYLAESARVLAVKDLVSSGSGALQREAQGLRERLQQCLQCLVERLEGSAPSLRFEWAQLAEDDRLDVERPETWPGLERAEAADFNAMRTLTELLAWWFRQLRDDASAAGRGALRHMVRAVVIESAQGDPNEILRGRVALPPKRLAVGEPLRLELNRIAAAGTRLQIMDDVQRVVGLLAVTDTDAQGTIAEVLRVDDARARVNTRFTVVATRATQHLTV